MNNIRLIQHDASSPSHNLVNTNTTTNTHQPQQLSHNFQFTHASSSLQQSMALQSFAPPTFTFDYNTGIYNPPTSYAAISRADTQHLNRLHAEYHELYAPENMLTSQPPHGSAFLQLGQPLQTSQIGHPFHSFGLKQESEPEPSSDESSFGGESHGGVIRKAERIKGPKGCLPNKIAIVAPELSSLMQSSVVSSSNHFCYVPGRLSLLSSAAKYEITVAEISRRINPPEALNASVLGSILRRAKSKDGGKSLREKLKTHGISLPAGRRKASNLTSFSALVEGESTQLATDFEKLCEHEFPSRSMAEYLTRLSSENNEVSLEQRKNIIQMTKQLISEFCDVLSKDGSALCNNSETHLLDPVIQKPLSHFSLVTHGFGNRAVRSGLVVFRNYLDESLKLLDSK